MSLAVRGIQERVLVAVGLPVIAILTYTILIGVYRLYFHPLAKFPGPKINAISPIPGILALLRGRLPMENKKLHDIYGPVVRVSPNELSFNTSGAWNDIYGHRPGHANFHKSSIHVGAVDPLPNASTLTMADDETHARQRRALSHAFSQQALMEQEDILLVYVNLFIKKLGEMCDRGEAFNLVNWYNFTTFDIIGDLAFGESFGCLDKGQFHEWVALIYETVKAGAMEQATRRFAEPGSTIQNFLVNFIPKEKRARRRDHLLWSQNKVLRRLENTKLQHKDFTWYILDQQKRGAISQNEVIVNGALFIVAGSETTANELSGLTARLLKSPRVYTKLANEIRDAFKTEDDITNDELAKLPYLAACLSEGLRIHPPLPTALMRQVPKNGDTIDGHWVPGGVHVGVGAWAATHSAANFKSPDEFVPERWIDKEWAGDDKKASQPFSTGPRGCIGKHLSYMEMRLILGRLLWHFDIVSSDGAPQWSPEGEMQYMKAYNTWEKPELNVTLKRVQR
ncbi:hypothetical protein Z517_11597 [Fonsecaea pedrosoi CBS 271.37]|uniref:Unplaced genomic scaffold supercont1.8, whole genome shotgun sequence n=1 Tax=Fonsecaea pedrosoi CBS 271.37 TaxID=1442368 RepID=A0A0D2EK70_9EURO|nr:uncharacterized protein Z517_11597 [Fonsecaea pedrosoi CBS 271.37]KIW74827.1 hypothetical protein Z517_11597 [Fonsecaea pedrosoi CBS 271.37]